MNPETLALYRQNVLSVTRQLYYSETNSNSLDLVLFLNGLPLVFVGMLVALPASAVLLVAFRRAQRGYLASDLYRDGAPRA